MLALCLCLGSCRGSDPESERRAAVTATLTRLQTCLRPKEATSQAQLAITEISRHPLETSVRLVAYAATEPAEFDLPVYLMSRGRWLINERERVYLLDENCREYKLRDRKSTSDKALPLDGKVSLPPGAAFEFKLSFPALPAEMHLGALVFGAQVIPFSLLPAPQTQPPPD